MSQFNNYYIKQTLISSEEAVKVTASNKRYKYKISLKKKKARTNDIRSYAGYIIKHAGSFISSEFSKQHTLTLFSADSNGIRARGHGD